MDKREAYLDSNVHNTGPYSVWHDADYWYVQHEDGYTVLTIVKDGFGDIDHNLRVAAHVRGCLNHEHRRVGVVHVVDVDAGNPDIDAVAACWKGGKITFREGPVRGPVADYYDAWCAGIRTACEDVPVVIDKDWIERLEVDTSSYQQTAVTPYVGSRLIGDE